MAVDKIPTSYKNSTAKWCNVRIKKMYGKRVKDHKFDAGKCQSTFFVLIDKINEIIDGLITEQEVIELVEGYNYATETYVNNEISDHNELTTIEGAHSTQPSDRRLKTDINFVGKSASGINIYTFRFLNSELYGSGLYQGVLSDEVPKSVLTQDTNGYDMVDYGKIDVNFVQINNV